MIKRLTILIALLMLAIANVYAETPSDASKAMRELVKKYNDTKGVNCITVTKGKGLEIMKMMLNNELGKSFMKGVTSITIIEYGEASEQVCQSLRKDLDQFTSLLKEFNLGGAKDIAQNQYSRCFACISEADAGKLTDFVIALEEGNTKNIMYMEGEIVVK